VFVFKKIGHRFQKEGRPPKREGRYDRPHGSLQ
jgi:hypothetical protein